MMSPIIEDSKPAMCLSPQEKLKSANVSQRNKRSHAVSSLAGASDAKKARLDDMFKNEFELDLNGRISDDYLRAMDFDDRLNQDIDWVAHDEMDLALSMEALVQDHATNDDVNDFDFSPSSFLRGGLAFEDPAEMASTFVDPAYIRLDPSSTKNAEKLLMSFDTMNFKIPSPTSASSKTRKSAFLEKETEVKQGEEEPASRITTADAAALVSSLQATNSAEEICLKPVRVSATSSLTSSLSVGKPVDSLLSALDAGTFIPMSNSKKIGSYSPAARKMRIQKFHEKRKNRTWKKSIKYDCRKKLADDRPRIKGRFVRVLENVVKTEPNVVTSPPNSVSAGYASSTGAMTAHSIKSEVPASCLSTSASAAKQTASVSKLTPVVVPATSSATLPFARMIASV
ncbi:unnamed protein product [Peronospora destructor]|uniref:CCT domain-containing protein n=1 Tax=Peronospora destructor TaxID=86335 RepID=A0AAV0V667_9STRA|nr:unnamed protein product [Peronospora destructor]